MNKRTLYLNPDKWDITLDGAGNIATAAGRYADAQNVANAVRLFTQDAYLRQRQGVPHFSLDLGVKPALSEVRAIYRETALAVENIADATVDIAGLDTETRAMTGTIHSTNENGETVTVEF
jgi:hypothetical protein